jgi:Holliday junction resolvasome RuvABC endonuclease subunit
MPNAQTVRERGDVWGVWNLKPDRWTSLGARVLRLRDELARFVDQHGCELIVYEEVRGHRGTDAAHIYGAIVAAIQMECELKDIPYEAVHTAEWKRYATGKGNCNIEQYFAAARAKWGDMVSTDDEAAALWMLDWRLDCA